MYVINIKKKITHFNSLIRNVGHRNNNVRNSAQYAWTLYMYTTHRLILKRVYAFRVGIRSFSLLYLYCGNNPRFEILTKIHAKMRYN